MLGVNGQFAGDVLVRGTLDAASQTGPMSVTGQGTPDGAGYYLTNLIDTRNMAAGVGGGVHFSGKYNTFGDLAGFSSISGEKDNGTNGNYAGRMVFYTRLNADTVKERLRISPEGYLYFKARDSAAFLGLTAPTTMAGTVLYVLPGVDGSANYLLKTDGAGNLAWTALGAVRQVIIQPAGDVALTADQALSSNIQLTSGGGVANWYTVTFPAGMTAGQEWIVSNTSGQIAILKVAGGTEVDLANGERKKVYYDGAEIREAPSSTTNANFAVTNPYVFDFFWQVDHDYMEFAPSGGNVEVRWPSASALLHRGRKTTIKCDSTTAWIDIKTAGAGADRTFRLLPGETGDFVIDDGGAIVRQERASRRVVITHDNSADYTVLHPDFLATILTIAGTLTVTRNLVLPTSDHKSWFCSNQTVGGFDIIVKTAAGTGVTIGNGKTAGVFCDGTNILRLTPDA
jgi:hypothetical protein